jgi:hypothetical protein
VLLPVEEDIVAEFVAELMKFALFLSMAIVLEGILTVDLEEDRISFKDSFLVFYIEKLKKKQSTSILRKKKRFTLFNDLFSGTGTSFFDNCTNEREGVMGSNIVLRVRVNGGGLDSLLSESGLLQSDEVGSANGNLHSAFEHSKI